MKMIYVLLLITLVLLCNQVIAAPSIAPTSAYVNGYDSNGAKTPVPFSLIKGVVSVNSVATPNDMTKAEVGITATKGSVIGAKLQYRETALDKWETANAYCKNITICHTEVIDPVCPKSNLLKLNCGKPTKKEVCTTEANNTQCFNDLTIKDGFFHFEVEHFSDYSVNVSGNFLTLEECLITRNNTGDRCLLNNVTHYEVFNSTAGYKNTKVRITANMNYTYIDFNSSELYGITTDNIWTEFGADNVTIKNLTLRGTQRHLRIHSTNTTFENVLSDTCVDDNYFSGADNLIIRNSTFINCSIHTANSDNMLITDVVVKAKDRAAVGTGIIQVHGWYNVLNDTYCEVSPGGIDGLESCISVGHQYNNITNNEVKALSVFGFEETTTNNYNNVFRNNFVYNATKGNDLGASINTFINNTFENCTEECFNGLMTYTGNGWSNIINNSFRNCGATHSDLYEEYRISYSPEETGGNCYNTFVGIYTADYLTFKQITADGTNVSNVVTGTNDFSLWLCSTGATRYMLIIEEPQSQATCNAVCGASGLACDYFENNFITDNGYPNNYTYNENTICGGGTSPAYLNFYNYTEDFQDFYPLRLTIGNNEANITGNVFEDTDGRTNYYSANFTGHTSSAYMAYAWLNHFYNGDVLASGNITFCYDNEGNYYEESLTPVSTDCGQINITDYTTYNLTNESLTEVDWTAQSSRFPVNYTLLFIGSSYSYEYSTNETEFNATLAYDEYNLSIIPNDGNYNGTIATGEVDNQGWETAIAFIFISTASMLAYLAINYHATETNNTDS